MTAPLPLPPADLHTRPLPTRVLPVGTRGYRCHDPAHGPIHFRPGGSTPPYRFDDPNGVFTVCYIGGTGLAAFVETFLRHLPTRTVSETLLKSRAISYVHFMKPVTVVEAHGSGLAQLGTTAALGAAKLAGAPNPYVHSQAWARALHDHPDTVDGIEFRSSHDDDQICLALFDRASAAVTDGNRLRIVADSPKLVTKAIRRYKLEII